MRKGNGRIKLIISLVLICAVIAVVAARLGTYGKGARMPEEALPGFDADKHYVVAGIRSLSELSGALDFIASAAKMSDSQKLSDTAQDMDIPGASSALGGAGYLSKAMVPLIERVKPYVEAADDAAVLRTDEDTILSIFTTDQKYAALVERMRGDGELAIWETKLDQGSEAYRWALGPADERVEFFIIKNAAGKAVQVSVSTSEEGALRSAAAWSGGAERAKIERKLKAPNYLIARLAVNAIDGSARDHKMEAAWSREGSRTVVDIDNDLELAGIKPKTSGMEGEPVPMYGTGEPVMLAAIDLPYLISAACPGIDDQAEFILSFCEALAGSRVPGEFRDDVKELMMTTRLSFGVFMKEDDPMPSSSYVVLESSKASRIQRYLGMASLFMNREKIDLWDDAYSADVDGIDVVVASAANKILLGTGKPGEFAAAAKRPADLSSVPEKGVLSMIYASTKYLTDKNTALGGLIAAEGEDDGELKEMLEFLRAIKSFLMVQASPSASQIVIQHGAAK